VKIDTLEAFDGGDTTEWIRIRGADDANPVLLLIQQGPGLPMINEARRFERLLGLEQAFTVVYWDQRGCGRSLRGQNDRVEISLDRMVADTVSLLELLRDRFGREIYVLGFSFGATVGATAAAARPDLVKALVAVSIDVDGAAAATGAYDFALATARHRGHRKAIRQLEAIGRPPHLEANRFSARARWAMNFGGVSVNETYGSIARELVTSLLRSSDYSFGDVVRSTRGLAKPPAALLRDIAEVDLPRALPRVDVPVVLVQGRLDQVAPGDAAQRYFDTLQAPSKHLVWFEHSAHTPQLDEPDRFRDLLARVRAGRLADIES
jgi:pimeloyl-ACP methyl ester carboxylesterase